MKPSPTPLPYGIPSPKGMQLRQPKGLPPGLPLRSALGIERDPVGRGAGDKWEQRSLDNGEASSEEGPGVAPGPDFL